MFFVTFVTITLNSKIMRKKILLGAILASSFGFSQVTVFEDSFDTYNDFIITGIGQWQTLDLDLLDTYTGGLPTGTPAWTNAGDPQAFMIFNPTTALVVNANDGCSATTETINFDPRTGAKVAACWDGVPAGAVTGNNDWLVSPVINLTGATGSALSVWVKSLSDCYGLEKYKIGVYVGTGTPTVATDFTMISGVPNLLAPIVWTERTQSLAAYDGQNIRIGINCRSTDAYMFMVDDFKITAATLSSESFSLSGVKMYPNPAKDLLNITSESEELTKVSITDLNGRVVKLITNNLSQISLGELSKGIYMVTIESATAKKIEKLIIE